VKGEFQGGERGQPQRRWWNYRQKRKKRKRRRERRGRGKRTKNIQKK